MSGLAVLRFGGSPHLKLLVAMIATPFCMNALQFWVTDNFIKKKGERNLCRSKFCATLKPGRRPLQFFGCCVIGLTGGVTEEEDDVSRCTDLIMGEAFHVLIEWGKNIWPRILSWTSEVAGQRLTMATCELAVVQRGFSLLYSHVRMRAWVLDGHWSNGLLFVEPVTLRSFTKGACHCHKGHKGKRECGGPVQFEVRCTAQQQLDIAQVVTWWRQQSLTWKVKKDETITNTIIALDTRSSWKEVEDPIIIDVCFHIHGKTIARFLVFGCFSASDNALKKPCVTSRRGRRGDVVKRSKWTGCNVQQHAMSQLFEHNVGQRLLQLQCVGSFTDGAHRLLQVLLCSFHRSKPSPL